MPDIIGPSQLRVLSRSELEDKFFEVQDARNELQEQLESLLLANERLTRRLEAEKEMTKRLRADYRTLSEETHEGGAQVSNTRSGDVRSDDQASNYNAEACEGTVSGTSTEDNMLVLILTPLQKDTPIRSPMPPQLQASSKAVAMRPIGTPSNASPEEDKVDSSLQPRSSQSNVEHSPSVSDISTREPTTASVFGPAPAHPATSSRVSPTQTPAIARDSTTTKRSQRQTRQQIPETLLAHQRALVQNARKGRSKP
ncbi:MAG: hypothetical protein Q9226_009236 [Calogaya cf. arnoldii]